MRALLEELVDLLIPPQCCRCERWLLPRNPRDAVLCESCRAAAPWIEPGLCIGCQERPPRTSSRRCADCGPEGRSGPRALASCTAPVRYEAEVVDWTAVFEDLKRIGFDGPVSVHCEFHAEEEDLLPAIKREVAFFGEVRKRVGI